MNSRKLTPGEIKNVVEKIRKRYGEFILRYSKPKILREAFEDRYVKALKEHVDISTFLLAEISAIEELISREEERIAAEPQKPPVKEARVGLADKVIDENRKLIEKYPDFSLHNDANVEVRKLLGALNAIEVDYWSELGIALRNTAYSMNSTEMLNLDSRLRSLSSTERDGIPPFLIRYIAQLKKFPRSHALIEREEKEYILESAFFLHDLIAVLDRVKRLHKSLGGEETRILDKVVSYVEGIISDFRLKEFKKKKEWERE